MKFKILYCRILWKKNEVADYEATTFSIFYNNALFLALVIFSSFYLLKSFSPSVYPFFMITVVWCLKFTHTTLLLFRCININIIHGGTIFMAAFPMFTLIKLHIRNCSTLYLKFKCFSLTHLYRNYVLSVSSAGGLLALLSTSSQ